jgi:hypothetical protein
MKRIIRLTESELIELIRMSVNEQDDTYEKFVASNAFRNCRGIALKVFGGEEGGDLPKQMKPWEAMIDDDYGYDELDKQTKKKISKEYYSLLRFFMLYVKGRNSNYEYTEVLDEQGKPFTKNMTQNNVNRIETMFKGGECMYFWFADNFPKFTPKSPLELFEPFQNLGGMDKIKDMVKNTGFNCNEYLKRLKTNVEQFNEQLKKKFPFPKPTGKTEFYIAWNQGNDNIYRFFNTFEEWKFGVELLKNEGNTGDVSEDGSATAGSALYKAKPQGPITSVLLK